MKKLPEPSAPKAPSRSERSRVSFLGLTILIKTLKICVLRIGGDKTLESRNTNTGEELGCSCSNIYTSFVINTEYFILIFNSI